MNSKYRYIAELIDRFYRGETDPGEEREIANFFRAEKDPLPENLERERVFFMAMAETAEDPADIPENEIPEDVVLRIESALEEAAANDGALSPLRRGVKSSVWKITFTAAACVALLATGGWIFRDFSQRKGYHRPTVQVADVNIHAKTISAEIQDSTSPTLKPEVSSYPRMAANSIPKARKRHVSRVNAHADKFSGSHAGATNDTVYEDNMWVVSDPEEARIMMETVLAMFESHIETGKKAYAMADGIVSDRVEKARETINGQD